MGDLLGKRGSSIPGGKDQKTMKVGLGTVAGWGVKLSKEIAHDKNRLSAK